MTTSAPRPSPATHGVARPPPARVKPRLPEDPGLSALRRATRAALVIPLAFAFAKLVIGNVQTTTFVAFGCFALLVMADLGGPRPPRAAAYIITTLVGAVLVSLGTLVSPIAWMGVLVMFLVGFSIQFAGVFGSYVAAAQTALLLSFVLAVSVPASSSAIGPRLTGWFLAGIVSTVAGVFFWPHFERLHLRHEAAEACHALARLVESRRETRDSGELAGFRQAAHDAVEGVRRQYSATPKRPAGPTRRDRAFAELLTELERILDFASRSFHLLPASVQPCIKEGNQLTVAVAQTLDSSADVLTGGAPPNLEALNATRLAHRRALDRWAEDALRAGTSPEDVLAGLDADHGLRVISYLALTIGANAIITAGGSVGDGVPLPAGTPLEGRARPLLRIVRTIHTHLTPESGVLQHSLRVGVGLALAVLLARVLRLEHAFWVVLGTLSVLRSNAFGTGRTTVEALVGTVAGFVLGAVFTIVVGASSPVLWIALPVVVFLATYAASAIGFVVGQAAFTVLVIILFNLISPVGWRVGLVRIEDVAVGVGISLITGLLLWPRGARGELTVAVAGLYRAVAAFLAGSFDRVLERGSAQEAVVSRRLVIRARDRAGDAFDQFLNERGTKPIDPQTAAFLIAAGTDSIIAGDLLNVIADMGYSLSPNGGEGQDDSDGATALQNQTQLLLAAYLRLADRLDGTTSALLSGPKVSDGALRQAALSYLQRWRADPAQSRSALAAVIAGEWIQQLGDLTVDLEAPVGNAVEGARAPWWR